MATRFWCNVLCLIPIILHFKYLTCKAAFTYTTDNDSHWESTSNFTVEDASSYGTVTLRYGMRVQFKLKWLGRRNNTVGTIEELFRIGKAQANSATSCNAEWTRYPAIFVPSYEDTLLLAISSETNGCRHNFKSDNWPNIPIAIENKVYDWYIDINRTWIYCKVNEVEYVNEARVMRTDYIGDLMNVWIASDADEDLGNAVIHGKGIFWDIVIDSYDIPTQAPTQEPTVEPTEIQVPTAAPSLAPSNVPSANPSNTPSLHPSSSPSQPPSNTPSQPPTNVPSFLPSNYPTNAPSANPTDSPSTSPSYPPTLAPSYSPISPPPTYSPSTSPTKNPILFEPSQSPTTDPTDYLAVPSETEPTTTSSFTSSDTDDDESTSTPETGNSSKEDELIPGTGITTDLALYILIGIVVLCILCVIIFCWKRKKKANESGTDIERGIGYGNNKNMNLNVLQMTHVPTSSLQGPEILAELSINNGGNHPEDDPEISSTGRSTTEDDDVMDNVKYGNHITPGNGGDGGDGGGSSYNVNDGLRGLPMSEDGHDDDDGGGGGGLNDSSDMYLDDDFDDDVRSEGHDLMKGHRIIVTKGGVTAGGDNGVNGDIMTARSPSSDENIMVAMMVVEKEENDMFENEQNEQNRKDWIQTKNEEFKDEIGKVARKETDMLDDMFDEIEHEHDFGNDDDDIDYDGGNGGDGDDDDYDVGTGDDDDDNDDDDDGGNGDDGIEDDVEDDYDDEEDSSDLLNDDDVMTIQ